MNPRFIIAATAAIAALAPATLTAQQTCRTFDEGKQTTTLKDSRIDEASGIASSWINEGIMWLHNDSGDSARVFAVDATGNTVATANLIGVDARDIEGLAIGPCSPGDETPCIWLGDIGDNDSVRSSVQLYRFAEPDLTGTAAEFDVSDVATFDLTYSDGPRNAEALLVHPLDGRVFIVEKTYGDPTIMWLVPTDTDTPIAQRVAETTLGEPGILSGLVTGGDFSPDGSELSIRTYQLVYTFCGDDPIEAFSGTPSKRIGVDLFQPEALTYARDGESLWTTTEVRANEEPAVVRMDLVQTEPADTGTSDSDAGSTGRGDVDPRADASAPDLGPEPIRSAAGCSCTVHETADAPGWVGVGLLFVFGLRRRR